MSNPADVIELGPLDEARRLWAGARKARTAPTDEVVSLCEALDLGLHAAEILVIHLLQPYKDRFPATIGVQLQLPTPEIDRYRDGIQVPKVLQFTDVIDLLSDDELECVSPGMHRGWEDRRFACRRSRGSAREAIGLTLTADEQVDLLLLSAYRNRLFRCPPPVQFVPADVQAALPALDRMVEHLLHHVG